MSKENIEKEEIKISGEDVIKKIKEIIKTGNVRRIIIKNEKGKSLIEIPITLGMVGVALLSVLAAIGAIAALVTKCTIVVEERKFKRSFLF